MTRSTQVLTAEAALKAIAVAQEKATEIGVPMTICIVDVGAITKAQLRMDGASLSSVDVAINKAYTSVAVGSPTSGLFDFIKSDAPLLAGLPSQPRMAIFGGGLPIQIGGELVGAIGVSGGHYSQDEVVAQAAVDALGS
jgi:uncharacterized protein GlcG (DUF336 family)